LRRPSHSCETPSDAPGEVPSNSSGIPFYCNENQICSSSVAEHPQVWDDKNFVAAIEKTGRKKIVLAGLWTETCVALPTVQAIDDGYALISISNLTQVWEKDSIPVGVAEHP